MDFKAVFTKLKSIGFNGVVGSPEVLK